MSDMISRADALAECQKVADEAKSYGIPQMSLGAHTCRDAIRALPAYEVAVKPLEWVEIRPGQYLEARVIGLLYSVRLGSDGIARWQAGHMGTWFEAPTIAAAKAAAQADYAARIRSALTATPAQDVVEIDLRAVMMEQIEEAANQSPWIPPEYTMNEIISDCCSFLCEPRDPAQDVAALVDYVLQDDLHNRLTPRVVDIAYSAFMLGRSGKNKDDGGPCDWFNDTKPMVDAKIAEIRAALARMKGGVS